jgi:GNAT superfamily N-acetyltransferase
MSGYLRWINEHFVRISRVIVHPKFRGIGVAVELVRQTLPLEGRPYVETLAVMARYNPFFERAGMLRVSAEVDRERTRTLKSAYTVLEGLGAREHVLLDPELFRRWYRNLSRGEKRKVREALRTVGEYWRREGGRRRLPLERAASRFVMLLNPPEYLIWKNPDPEYSDYPEPLGAVTSLPSRLSSS